MAIQNVPVFLIGLVMIYLPTANTYAFEKTASDTLLEQHNSGKPDVETNIEKRAMPLSLNADLRMLARMLFASQRRRRVDQYARVRQQMSTLGKRSGGHSLGMNDRDPIGNGQEMSHLAEHVVQNTQRASKYEHVSDDDIENAHQKLSLLDTNAAELQKRGQRLSINGALSSLADMLAASGRRRLEEELAVNKERLLKLGR
ncbi:uncharacterized protein LOC132560376 [Ylistrum balloti]|uniref:uncharacterized protein LOC132560376 n=1 Tax=Ylistrum balloti TaxID=509963 RepID=UPI002905CCBB|nr:uncharacterized protein LOC132560376 [Ylistrum balloti]